LEKKWNECVSQQGYSQRKKKNVQTIQKHFQISQRSVRLILLLFY